MQRKPEEFKAATSFIVKTLDTKGMLDTPMESGWGRSERLFENYGTKEEAKSAIVALGSEYETYVVLECVTKVDVDD